MFGLCILGYRRNRGNLDRVALITCPQIMLKQGYTEWSHLMCFGFFFQCSKTTHQSSKIFISSLKSLFMLVVSQILPGYLPTINMAVALKRPNCPQMIADRFRDSAEISVGFLLKLHFAAVTGVFSITALCVLFFRVFAINRIHESRAKRKTGNINTACVGQCGCNEVQIWTL